MSTTDDTNTNNTPNEPFIQRPRPPGMHPSFQSALPPGMRARPKLVGTPYVSPSWWTSKGDLDAWLDAYNVPVVVIRPSEFALSFTPLTFADNEPEDAVQVVPMSTLWEWGHHLAVGEMYWCPLADLWRIITNVPAEQPVAPPPPPPPTNHYWAMERLAEIKQIVLRSAPIPSHPAPGASG